jgi:hypothetical protein
MLSSMIKTYVYFIVIFCFCATNAEGQEVILQGQRSKFILISECNIELDSVTIAPISVIVFDKDGNDIFDFSIQNRTIIFEEEICSSIIGDSVNIQYRVLPFDIEREYFHLDSTMMKVEDQAIYIGSDYSFTPKGKEIIDAKGLDYNGSFSRGFSVGNSQSLVLNSNFNLQLVGDLGNKIKVVAAISDDNIPIQPEGNTQLIQEFDKVFIKVSRDKTAIIAGDYNLERPKSYFVNYFKKLKGLSGSNISDFGNGKKLTSNGSFAISRGKFARQTLETKEGNQGPYKLTGNNGERFLIVLSGSEKVYLDGKLLARGLDYDYIIDYNRAEVTFTPNRLIARESRIIVEYEYRTNNYLRSVYATNIYYNTPKYDLNFNFYNEQDSKTATGDIVLDSTDITLLQMTGDDINGARISSIRPLGDTVFIPGQVRYRLNPNVMKDDPDTTFLEYSADVSEQLYVASFIEVPMGEGRYIIDDNSLVNGRVYKYVGRGNGIYEPFTSLTPPEKKQILSFGVKLRPKENINIGSEISLSNTDINRFADSGNNDNVGYAAVLTYDHKINLNKKRKVKLFTDNKFEFVDANYVPLNPYRTAEFSRDWNISNQVISGRQNLIESTIGIGKIDSMEIKYSVKYFGIENRDTSFAGNYKGVNQNARITYRNGGFTALGKMDYLSSEGFGEKTLFQRPKAEISQILSNKRNLKIGVIYEGETNNKMSTLIGSNDSLTNSFAFDIYRVYLENSKENKLHYKFQFSSRKDFFPKGENLLESIATNEVNTSTKWTFSPKHALSFNFGVRDFDVRRQELLPNAKSKRTLIGRLDHNLQAWDGLFLTNTNYLINSGQEPKVEYFYEKVESGQGDYKYIGNPDSVLVNNNFRYAPNPGAGDYIRLSLINNEFITTNNQSLTQSLRIDPKKFFSARKKKKRKLAKNATKEEHESNKIKKTGWAENVLSRLSTVSTFRIAKKVEDDGSSQESTFLNFSSLDTNLVSYNSLISNTLFINRGNPTIDFQVGNKVTENVFTQISGRESRSLNESFFRSRVRLAKSADLILNLKNGNRDYTSIIDPTRNLDINFYSINPELSYRPSSNFRINLQYAYDNRKQQISPGEVANSHDFTLATTYRQASNANLNFSISYVNVTTNVQPNSPIEFDLLEGLKEGKNFIWNTLFTKRLSNNIDLNISYEGRKTGDASTVHIARAQVKATF